jgi:hypothetical protein
VVRWCAWLCARASVISAAIAIALVNQRLHIIACQCVLLLLSASEQQHQSDRWSDMLVSGIMCTAVISNAVCTPQNNARIVHRSDRIPEVCMCLYCVWQVISLSSSQFVHAFRLLRTDTAPLVVVLLLLLLLLFVFVVCVSQRYCAIFGVSVCITGRTVCYCCCCCYIAFTECMHLFRRTLPM